EARQRSRRYRRCRGRRCVVGRTLCVISGHAFSLKDPIPPAEETVSSVNLGDLPFPPYHSCWPARSGPAAQPPVVSRQREATMIALKRKLADGQYRAYG